VPLTQKCAPQSASVVHALGWHTLPEQAKSTVCVDVQSESLVHDLDTQCPLGAQLSFEPQSLADLQAGMQSPVLPFSPHTHGPPGPQTIGSGGAASWIVAQSESTLQGFCGISQIPQPVVTPPGLHESVDGQSALV
jgi:hypothetical protein